MSKHTIERVSSISLDDVWRRLQAADARFRKAAASIVNRKFRKGEGPICPPDCDLPDPPEVPHLPEEIKKAVAHPTWHLEAWENSRTWTSCDSILTSQSSLKSYATPKELVEAINAADQLADEAEELAKEYERTTAEVIRKHVKEQAEAINELVALCAQSNA